MKNLPHFLQPTLIGLFLGACFALFDVIGFAVFIPLAILVSRLRSSASIYQLSYEGLFFFLGWFAVGCYPHALFAWWAYPLGWLSYTFFYWLVWIGIIFIRKEISQKHGLIAFVLLWIGWEYIQGMIEPFIPWFAIGNGLLNFEYYRPLFTSLGTTGASLFVLLNAVFLSFTFWKHGKIQFQFTSILMLILLQISPLFFPAQKTSNSNTSIKIALYQPYRAPLDTLDHKKEVSFLNEKLSPNVDLIVFPENYIQPSTNIKTPSSALLNYQKLASKKAATLMLIGGNVIEKNQSYNAVIAIKQNEVSFRGKTKLIGGIEQTLGSGGFTKGKSKSFSLNKELTVAPFICIESIFDDFMTSAKKANLISIHTNDVWFENSYAFHMHAKHAQVRAQQLGKTILRSGNSGVTGIYYPDGTFEVIPAKTKDLFQSTINIKQSETFFSLYGDFVGRLGMLFAPFLLLYAFVKNRKP